MAEHFIVSAQNYFSDDPVVSNQQRLLLSRKFLALGCRNDALDLAIQKIGYIRVSQPLNYNQYAVS
jgi:hypothetical protein